jgi:hypothetical protein
MIQSLDDTLFHLLAREMKTLGPSPANARQIRFQPPDATWRQHISQLAATRKALNVYLVDIRENRKLRSNEMFRQFDAAGGVVDEYPAPARADCHYLITAWSSADEDLAHPEQGKHGKTGEEHAILHETASLLNAHQPLVPKSVFGNAFPANFDPDLEGESLPTALLPVEGFPKYAEFWGTMGAVHPWKPAVYLVVTVPLRVTHRSAGPPVKTVFSDWHQDKDKPGETLIDFGGTVLDGATPVKDAWVRLETSGHQLVQSATSDSSGHFRFVRVEPQQYLLRAGASGVGIHEGPVDVPSPTGDYDVQLT